MFEGIKKGFRIDKKPNRKQIEAQEKSSAFIKEYEQVCIKHELQLDAKIEVTPNGVMPKIQILPFQPKPEEFETKDWDECKKENEETRERLENEEKEDV